MSTKMVEWTLVREHVLKMISLINKLDMLGAQLVGETKVDVILTLLSDSFNQFVMNYESNKMDDILSELLNMLQAAKDPIKKENPTFILVEKFDYSLMHKFKGKILGRNGSLSSNKAQVWQSERTLRKIKQTEILSITINPIIGSETIFTIWLL